MSPPPPDSSSPQPADGVAPPVASPLPGITNTCSPDHDTRTIILAYGVGHRPIDNNKVVMADRLVAEGLPGPAPVPDPDGNGFTYDARANHPTLYTVKFIYTKAEFATYLQDPTVHLIYCGHSRDGRGPCFLDKGTPVGTGEYWGDAGIFKMGFQFIGVATSDIRQHGYTARLSSAAQAPTTDAIDISKCEPVHLGPNYGALELRTTGAPPKVPVGQYWGYSSWDKEVEADDDWNEQHLASLEPEWLVVESGEDDLAQVKPQARVLCLFSCDTQHYWKPIVQARAWTSADSGYVYYTTATAAPTGTTALWLRHLFTYKGSAPSGCMPWKPSLDYAMAMTNADLAKANKTFPPGSVFEKGWLLVQ